MTASATPTRSDEREVVLDALRGVALFGVLTVNTLTAFRISLFEQFLPPSPARMPAASGLDAAISQIIVVGFEMKAFILFSFMFGVGLAAQHDRARARGASFAPLAARRLAMLLFMGVVHLVFIWNGDILTLYAVLGIIAAPLISRLNARWLLALAIACFVVQVSPLPFPPLFPDNDALREHIEAANHIYPYGSFRDVLQFRIMELRPISVLLVWCVPRVLGLFLLGAAAWRSQLFRETRRRVVARIAMVCLPLGALAMWLVHANLNLHVHVLLRMHDLIDTWGSILLALGYGSAIVAVFHTSTSSSSSRLRKMLSAFAPLGRMALTSYLTQSIVLGFIFYGYGFGQFSRLGEASTLLIVLAIFGAQMIFAKLWLTRFRFGPIEWAWRSFTYFKLQSFRVVVADGERMQR